MAGPFKYDVVSEPIYTDNSSLTTVFTGLKLSKKLWWEFSIQEQEPYGR